MGGEYGAAYTTVGPGTLKMTFQPASAGSAQITVNERVLKDTVRAGLAAHAAVTSDRSLRATVPQPMLSQVSAVVCYDNPYDNVVPMAHHFFSRCLEEGWSTSVY